MKSERGTFAKQMLKRLFRWLYAGHRFKLYAPQAPAAVEGGRHKLAICDLIPNLGDKVMMFPLLDALRRENPDIEISLFTLGAGRLIGIHPAVDHLYVMEEPSRKSYRSKVPYLARLVGWWWRRWRHLSFHTVVVLRGGVDPYRSHHLAWLVGGNSRVAYSTLLEPELPDDQYGVSPLFTAEVRQMRGVHEVSRGSEVLQLAGLLRASVAIKKPVVSLSAIAHSAIAQNYRQELGLEDQAYAVVALGASIPRRAWPVRAFAELASRELLTRNWRIVLVGGPELAPLASEFKKYVGGEDLVDLTAKTDFQRLVAICGGAKCFVGNDSGPSHIAGACGVPTLVVTAFASSSPVSHHASPARSHPVGPFVGVVQPKVQLPPCEMCCTATEAHCIKQVTVEEATLALQKILTDVAVTPGMPIPAP
jgi:ADP-heptose:LPS heptosyltransferase